MKSPPLKSQEVEIGIAQMLEEKPFGSIRSRPGFLESLARSNDENVEVSVTAMQLLRMHCIKRDRNG